MNTARTVVSRHIRTCCIVLSALACVSAVQNAGATQTSCASAAAVAERQYGLPAGLLLAIGKVESGEPDPRTRNLEPWPWSVDAQGRSLSFPSKVAAVAWVGALQAEGESSIDVGCFQINLHFHPDAFADLDAAFDPARNADVAARFLLRLHAQFDDWGQATGAYHSQTASLAIPYRRQVANAVDGGMGGAGSVPVATPDPTLALLHDAWLATLPQGDRRPAATPAALRATPPSPAMLEHLPADLAVRAAPATNLRDLIWRQH